MLSKLNSIIPLFTNKSLKMLVATHLSPDGDAIGSALAVAFLGKYYNHEVRLYLPEGIPNYLKWLPADFKIETSLVPEDGWVPQTLFITDCGEPKRAGKELEDFFISKILPTPEWEDVISVNIDHHEGNPEFATHNVVSPTWAATGQLVGVLAEKMAVPLAGNLGLYIYLCLISDTGNFSYGNTTEAVLSMAARIVKNGLHIGEFTAKLENSWTLNRMHLWGELMQQISLHKDGYIASCIVSKSILDKYSASKSDLDGFASWLRKIHGVEIAIFIREDDHEKCKISLRSEGKFNVRHVAKHFKGGGHDAAAGFELQMSPENAQEAVLEEINNEMNK